jgi:hypothetical protein
LSPTKHVTFTQQDGGEPYCAEEPANGGRRH